MKRRDCITLLVGAAAAPTALWPRGTRAERAANPVVGYLGAETPEAAATPVEALRKGLSEMGYVEGRNVALEFRWAQNQAARIPELAAALVRLKVSVLVAGALHPALQLKAATATIPIVFATASDPVETGLVASLNRPGGNVTGVTSIGGEIGSKQLGLLHTLLPRATRFALLVDPLIPLANSMVDELRATGAPLGLQVEGYTARTNQEIETAFANLVQARAEAVVVAPSALFQTRQAQLSTLAVYHRVPTIFPSREFTGVGGLMSYGASSADQLRQVGIYVGRILKGEKPADLPVMQPTRFEFVINLQTARLLGLEIPPTLLAIADEVIE